MGRWPPFFLRGSSRYLNERKVLTPDLGSSAPTSQVGDEVVRLPAAG